MIEDEFSLWLQNCSEQQAATIRSVRAFIKINTENLEESVNEGKWLNRYIIYSKNSKMIFAMAPKGKAHVTLHLMPYYGSSQLRLRHQLALAPFLSGKSSIAFKNFEDLPYENLLNIVREGTKAFLEQNES